jgi:hypothetical protein
MLHRLQSRVRNVVAMCCMALMAVVLAQTAVTTLDRAQHAYGVEHAPVALAGQVHLDHEHDHGDVAVSADYAIGDDHHDGGPKTDDGRPTHHHAAEAPQLATLTGERAPDVLLARMISPQTTELDGLPQLVGARLERPPKFDSKTIA